MSYYLVLNYDVHDAETFEKYVPAAMPSIISHGVKVLAADREPNDVEGQSKQSLVLLEFESKEAAERWYHSPEYQEAAKLRKDSTEGWARWVPPFVMPE